MVVLKVCREKERGLNMSTYSKIADGLRLIGITGCTNDIVNSWLKGLGMSGTTPDMLFSYLRSIGLTGSLSDMLSAYIFSAIEEKVLIDLSETSGSFYSLGTEWVASGDYSTEIYAYFTGDLMRLHGNSANFGSRGLITADGAIFWSPEEDQSTTAQTGNSLVPTNKLSLIKLERIGTVGKIYLNGNLVLTATVTTGPAKINMFGKQETRVSGGLISEPYLTDLTTPANSLVFNLDQLTANTEINNGVTLTYQNIGTGTDVRDTYTLSNGDTQWISDLRTIDIAAQA